MSDAPPRESPGTRPAGRRFIVLATVAALVLLAAGFALGRVTDDEDAGEEPATATRQAGAGDHDRGSYPRVDTHAAYDAADVQAVFPPTIVRDGDILEQEEGSPERALLEWWQAYQFDDVEAVMALTSRATIDEIGDDKLAKLIQLPGPGLEGLGILDVSESGDTASVNAGLLTFQPEEPGGEVPTEPSNSTPETFAMVKEGGEWRFAATEFLIPKLTSLSQ